MTYREEGASASAGQEAVHTSGTQANLPGFGEKHPVEDLVQYWREYARERPEVVAMWAFGIGFVLGWRLKPW